MYGTAYLSLLLLPLQSTHLKIDVAPYRANLCAYVTGAGPAYTGPQALYHKHVDSAV